MLQRHVPQMGRRIVLYFVCFAYVYVCLYSHAHLHFKYLFA